MKAVGLTAVRINKLLQLNSFSLQLFHYCGQKASGKRHGDLTTYIVLKIQQIA